MTAPAPPSALFLPQIESLRGLAALTVAYAHCGIILVLSGDGPSSFPNAMLARFLLEPLDLLANARAAVVIFFVVSGLVLALALDRTAPSGAIRAVPAFLSRRALRLYPAHIAALLLYVPLASVTVHRLPVLDPSRLASPLLEGWFNPRLYPDIDWDLFARTLALAANSYNPVVWTLFVELVGALCLPLFAALSRPGRLAIDLPALALLAGIGLWVDAPGLLAFADIYLPAFYLGCMARTHGRRWVTASRRRLPYSALLGLGFVLLVLPEALVGPDVAHNAVLLGMAVASFGLVSLLAWGTSPATERVMLHPWARFLGRVSYSFYLWHSLLLLAFARILLAVLPTSVFVPWDQFIKAATFAVTALAALAVASLSYGWIERPFLALGRNLGSARMPSSTIRAEEAAAP
jgi:peptidoglycan/LPS O-acetylase OafA/YrhL